MNGVVNVKLRTSSGLARLVKNARTQRNLTQQNVADAVSITRQSVARLERGNGGISFDTVLLIFDYLDIHLTATGEHRTSSPTAPATQSAALAAADALTLRETSQQLNRHIPGSVLVDPLHAAADTDLDDSESAE
ncbi:helix-turn-helix transcriptional regulator [Pseudoclavibacter sp. 13-3]|uniref:helix-turn-helix transcriptional regulator n=1 Tax=Pseudoclavibacter sp. 13-3 TaxID=2901228 RepID=UPI001E5A65A1|nr:helix-turn-helix transcriptional regulator [Pseudoclavibacter sp. 13-3]MCD7101821.1 helix-turn-helix transcriptional regulator [Pseudoclavibacter sp. 13-3]